MEKRWHLTGKRTLGLIDRLRVLFGMPLVFRFESPDGECNAACGIAVRVQQQWPEDNERWRVSKKRKAER